MFEELIKDNLPALPGYSAKYRVIQFEPIFASGERFTVGIMVQAGNESIVIQTIQPKTLKCMFSGSYRNAFNLIATIISSADAYLKSGKSIDDWRAPFEGVYLSDTRNTLSANKLDGILFQAITSFSSLYQGKITDLAINEIVGDKEQDMLDLETGKLIANIKKMLSETYKQRFNKRISLKNGFTVNVDYDGPYLKADIANFVVKHPKAALDKAKSKLIDFQVYRDEIQTSLVNNNFEFILANEKNLSNETEDAVGNIIELASRIDINISQLSSPQDIANRIVKLESIRV